MAQVDLVEFLQTVPLFSDLEPDALHLLAEVSRLKPAPKGYFLFFQDDPGEAAYVVYSGVVAIVLTTADGRELVINEMRPGECFGELALLEDAPRSAGAVAREDSQVVRMPRREFMTQLESQPILMRRLLDTIAGRLRNSGERESALAFLNAPARMARFLLHRAEEDSQTGDLVEISQEELSLYIGVTRQTVAKILGGWRRDGWIITGRGRIMLVDLKALRHLAEEPV